MNGRALAPTAKKAAWTAAPVNRGVLQRQCACGQHTVAGGECEACRQGTPLMQRRSGGQAEPGIAPPIVHEVLRSPGRPLDRSVRAALEPRFKHDFSHVRIHTDGKASESARAVNASAYTVGRDIVFAANRYAPATGTGAGLLAHELAHTIQQGGAGSFGSAALEINHPADAGEREADRAAAATVTGFAAEPLSAAAVGVQRQTAGPGPGSQAASDSLIENVSPFLASAIGSTSLHGFDPGRAGLKAAHKTKLDWTAHHIVVLLRQYSLSTVRVTGFGDKAGTAAAKLTLASARAGSVKQALVDGKVPQDIITTEGKVAGSPGTVKVSFHPKAFPANLRGFVFSGDKKPIPVPRSKPMIDLNYHPKFDPPDAKRSAVSNSFLKPLGSVPSQEIDKRPDVETAMVFAPKAKPEPGSNRVSRTVENTVEATWKAKSGFLKKTGSESSLTLHLGPNGFEELEADLKPIKLPFRDILAGTVRDPTISLSINPGVNFDKSTATQLIADFSAKAKASFEADLSIPKTSFKVPVEISGSYDVYQRKFDWDITFKYVFGGKP